MQVNAFFFTEISHTVLYIIDNIQNLQNCSLIWITLWHLLIYLCVLAIFLLTWQTLLYCLKTFSYSLSTALNEATVMQTAYSYCVEKFKYYFIHAFCLSSVSTPFLFNSTRVANKVKANIELFSLCPLHRFQIFLFLQRSLRKWEKKKQTQLNEAIEIVSTHCGKSQWFLKVTMDTNPACMDKGKKTVLSECL